MQPGSPPLGRRDQFVRDQCRRADHHVDLRALDHIEPVNGPRRLAPGIRAAVGHHDPLGRVHDRALLAAAPVVGLEERIPRPQKQIGRRVDQSSVALRGVRSIPVVVNENVGSMQAVGQVVDDDDPPDVLGCDGLPSGVEAVVVDDCGIPPPSHPVEHEASVRSAGDPRGPDGVGRVLTGIPGRATWAAPAAAIIAADHRVPGRHSDLDAGW